MRSRNIGVAIVALVLGGWPVLAGPPLLPAVPAREIDDVTLQKLLEAPYQQEETVSLVLLPASVTDGRGRAVVGLDEKDFRLFDNHEPRDIIFFASEAREPIAVAFLLDLSGSMRFAGRLERAKQAIRAFVEGLEPNDSVALIGFADEQVTWITDFTPDHVAFLERLEVQNGYGQTALHDAVAAAPELVDAKAAARRGIVLVTDGSDNASTLAPAAALEAARRTRVPVYAIDLQTIDPENLPRETRDENAVLQRITHETGGRTFPVHDAEDIAAAVATLENELRFQYVIGFYPEPAADGQFHPVRLEVAGRKLHVHTRSGYYTR